MAGEHSVDLGWSGGWLGVGGGWTTDDDKECFYLCT